jgi:hypothetical protein
MQSMSSGARDEWEDRLKRWAKSGLPGTEFAEQEGVGYSTLQGWARRLRTQGSGSASKAPRRGPALLPVLVSPSGQGASDGSALQIVALATGLMVRVPAGFADEELLARVVRVLGAAR